MVQEEMSRSATKGSTPEFASTSWPRRLPPVVRSMTPVPRAPRRRFKLPHSSSTDSTIFCPGDAALSAIQATESDIMSHGEEGDMNPHVQVWHAKLDMSAFPNGRSVGGRGLAPAPPSQSRPQNLRPTRRGHQGQQKRSQSVVN